MPIQVQTERVEFEDGTSIVVAGECWDTSLHVSELLEAAKKAEPHTNVRKQVFRLAYYPFMAGSIIEGDVPSEDAALTFRTTELDKWYEAVKRVAPHYFATAEAAVDANQAEEEKKRKKQPPKSSTG